MCGAHVASARGGRPRGGLPYGLLPPRRRRNGGYIHQIYDSYLLGELVLSVSEDGVSLLRGPGRAGFGASLPGARCFPVFCVFVLKSSPEAGLPLTLLLDRTYPGSI